MTSALHPYDNIGPMNFTPEAYDGQATGIENKAGWTSARLPSSQQ
jgi:hypothetical protein